MADNYDSFSAGFRFPEKAYQDFILVRDAVSAALRCEAGSPEIPAWWIREANASIGVEISEAEAERIAAEWRENPDKAADFLENQLCLYNCSCETEFDAAADGGTLYVWNDGMSSAENVAILLSHVMAHNDMNTPITFSEAYTCSKPRTDEFGGIAFAIGPNIVLSKGTNRVEEELAGELAKRLAERSVESVAPKA